MGLQRNKEDRKPLHDSILPPKQTLLGFPSLLKSTLPVMMSQTDEQGCLDGVIFLCSQCHPSESFRNIFLGKARGRWPNSSAAHTPNKQSSRYQMSPGCDSPLQPGNTWSVSENALPSCQACCFNGLISETIIVNTSQRTCLQDSGEMAWSPWVMTTKSESRRPSLKNEETLVIQF